jgi:GT2 family glycosyltransferase
MISIVIISKDEASLDDTLVDVANQANSLTEPWEIVVVDASSGRLDYIRQRHEGTIRWVPFEQPAGVRVSIPHQRNVGVRAAHGDIIVFTDAGCRPEPEWLTRLVAPLRQAESMTAGVTVSTAGHGLYELPAEQIESLTYLRECPTLNVAFRREAFDTVGGFDERFAYGSDVDFSWRLNDVGFRIRHVPDAVIRHDYGTWRRQLRRSYTYGKARARLYRKHRNRLVHVLNDDPVAVLYPLFLLGLPLMFVFPFYPALLLIPAWRNRSRGMIRVLIDHLCFGVGVLAELTGR